MPAERHFETEMGAPETTRLRGQVKNSIHVASLNIQGEPLR